MQNKKSVVIYGNCHATAVAENLKSVPQFSERYEILPLLPIQDIPGEKYLNDFDFSRADVFIHQSIRKENRYGQKFASENILPRLKKGCRVIAIPNLYRLPVCFFPNYSPEKEFTFHRGQTLFFRDAFIDKLFIKRTGLSRIEEIYEQALVPVADAKEQFDDFIAKVKDRERAWDIKISAFILDNYRDHLLFYDPNHPTEFVIDYICCQLLHWLDVDSPADGWKKRSFPLDSYQMPLYSGVAKELELKYTTDEIRRTGRKIQDRRMDLSEYIRQYTAMEWQNDEAPIDVRIRSFFRWFAMKCANKVKIR